MTNQNIQWIKNSTKYQKPPLLWFFDNKMQAGQISGFKWKERARLGVNWGFLPQHAKSISLVLSLTTGLVSPQFHCKFDDQFETVTFK
jgi:hypothetical protein